MLLQLFITCRETLWENREVEKGFTFRLILQDLAEEVEAAGAARIAFNPLTPAFAAKALMRAAEAEGLPLAPEAARVLAERSAGDLRAAMEALQLAAAGTPLPPPPQKNVREL